jgi:hypothetical protein
MTATSAASAARAHSSARGKKDAAVESVGLNSAAAAVRAHTDRNARSGSFVIHSAAGAIVQNLSLADPEAAADLLAFRNRISKSPASARAWLQEVGIQNASGKLTRRYGGK